MENKHYIYFHINPLNNKVFYVGQGINNRAKSKSSRNNHWIKLVNKYGFIVDIVETNLSKEEANQKEIFYINFFGRIDLKKGTLVNLTDGGEGSIGFSHTIETKKKMSINSRKYKTNEEKIAAQKESKKKYRQSNKGKEKEFNYSKQYRLINKENINLKQQIKRTNK